MNREQAVKFALKNAELEGYKISPQDQEMWNKIAKGELQPNAALEAAQEFVRRMKEKRPEMFVERRDAK